MKKSKELFMFVLLTSMGAHSVQAMQQLKTGMQATKQKAQVGVKASRKGVGEKVSPQMRQVQQYLKNLTGLQACMTVQNCNEQQIKQFKLAVNGLKALAAAGVLAAIGVGVYKGYQRYGDRTRLSLPSAEVITGQFSGKARELMEKMLSLTQLGQKWTEDKWIQFKKQIQGMVAGIEPLEMHKILGLLTRIWQWAAGIAESAKELGEDIKQWASTKVGESWQEMRTPEGEIYYVSSTTLKQVWPEDLPKGAFINP